MALKIFSTKGWEVAKSQYEIFHGHFFKRENSYEKLKRSCWLKCLAKVLIFLKTDFISNTKVEMSKRPA